MSPSILPSLPSRSPVCSQHLLSSSRQRALLLPKVPASIYAADSATYGGSAGVYGNNTVIDGDMADIPCVNAAFYGGTGGNAVVHGGNTDVTVRGGQPLPGVVQEGAEPVKVSARRGEGREKSERAARERSARASEQERSEREERERSGHATSRESERAESERARELRAESERARKRESEGRGEAGSCCVGRRY
eukprot:2961115-Rhodomonas_salina.1